MLEVSPVHHRGESGGLVRAGSKPGQALLKRDPFGYSEGPVDGVQLGVTVHATVVADVRPRKEARVGRYLPLSFFLEELELGQSFSLYRGCSNATLSGRDAAVSLHLGGVGAVMPWGGTGFPLCHSRCGDRSGQHVSWGRRTRTLEEQSV